MACSYGDVKAPEEVVQCFFTIRPVLQSTPPRAAASAASLAAAPAPVLARAGTVPTLARKGAVSPGHPGHWSHLQEATVQATATPPRGRQRRRGPKLRTAPARNTSVWRRGRRPWKARQRRRTRRGSTGRRCPGGRLYPRHASRTIAGVSETPCAGGHLSRAPPRLPFARAARVLQSTGRAVVLQSTA